MDYEKKYNEALERARKIHSEIVNNEIIGFPGQIEGIFPELREDESEDERIRKYLVEELKVAKSVGELKFTIPQPTREECIAYLEKQQEQKPELVQQPPITYTYNSNASRDERLKAALLALLNSDLIKVKEGGYFTKQDLIDWVEKQKESSWKPSEEHLSALLAVLNDPNNIGSQTCQLALTDLYEQLKKL